MSIESNCLPGVPLIESPFFARDFIHPDPEIDRIARDLHADGLAVIDFPDPDFNAVADAIIEGLGPAFDLPAWRASGWADGNGLRAQDAWRDIAAVRRLAVNARLLEILSALYGRRAMPFQTLNFPVGTQQHFHSDAVHFHCVPQRFMCGVWIALEDLQEDAGPLVYYPGTHKWPVCTNDELGVRIDADGPPRYARFEETWRALVEVAGVRPRRFLPRKGQAIIWAANLLHGGAPQRRPELTRWSQVTHYFFDDCAYYTPLASSPFSGRIAFRELVDIATGVPMCNQCAGKPVPSWFMEATRGRVEGMAPALPPDFDAERYYQANPDVRAAGVDAAAHWMHHGWREGRALAPLATG
jgi:Phytanoyl-CoA dioxygenase (PhyH)